MAILPEGSEALAQSIKAPALEVIHLLYSGRRNPRYSLSHPADLEQLRRLVSDLPPAAAPRWPALGERGFLIRNLGAPELPEELRVFRGVIRILDRGSLRYYQDRDGLEGWLGSLF